MYISQNQLNELSNYFSHILLAFSESDQKVMQNFLDDLQRNGFCTFEQYNEVNLLFSKFRAKKCVVNKIKRKNKEQSCTEEKIFEIIETVRMLFAMRTFFGKEEENKVPQTVGCIQKVGK